MPCPGAALRGTAGVAAHVRRYAYRTGQAAATYGPGCSPGKARSRPAGYLGKTEKAGSHRNSFSSDEMAWSARSAFPKSAFRLCLPSAGEPRVSLVQRGVILETRA